MSLGEFADFFPTVPAFLFPARNLEQLKISTLKLNMKRILDLGIPDSSIRVKFDTNTTVVVRTPEYFRKLGLLLQNTPPEYNPLSPFGLAY